MPTMTGECGVGVVAGAWPQQAATEHERGVLALLRSRRERAGGVGVRRGLCEVMREC
jgi:hypothetical protein